MKTVGCFGCSAPGFNFTFRHHKKNAKARGRDVAQQNSPEENLAARANGAGMINCAQYEQFVNPGSNTTDHRGSQYYANSHYWRKYFRYLEQRWCPEKLDSKFRYLKTRVSYYFFKFQWRKYPTQIFWVFF